MLCFSRAGGCLTISVLAIASLAVTAIAAPTPADSTSIVTGHLTYERALELASRYELRLRSAGLRADAARARIADANRRQNPTLSASEENFGGQLGSNRSEATLAIGQTLELGGDRKARQAAAEAEYQLSLADVAVVGREGLGTTAEHFITAWALQTRIKTLREGEAVTRLAIRAATERHAAGAALRLEILRAESQATSQAVERQRAEADLAMARRSLALRWGAAEATFDSLVVPQGIFDQTDSTALRFTFAEHPELRRASAGEALAAARVQSAAAARTPDPTLSAGIRRLEEVPGTGFVMGIELPIPLWTRGNGSLTAARHELDAAVLDRRATEQFLRAELASAQERLRSAAAAYDTLRLRVVPGREQLVAELLQSYRSGRSSYLDLAAEQRNLVDAELALVDAQADLWRAEAQLTFLSMPKEAR